MATPIIMLGVHNDHKVGVGFHAPAEAARGHEHLNGTRQEQLLYHPPLEVRETLMEVGNTISECFNQGLGRGGESWVSGILIK